MSQEQLIQAVAEQVAVVAAKEGRTPEEVLDDMRRYLLKQRFRSFVAYNRAEAEAKGYKPSDVEEWIAEDRRQQRGA